MKQRLSYTDELTREHQISSENFRKNIETQQNELEEFRRRLSDELSRLTLNDVDEIAVSREEKNDEKQKTPRRKKKTNRRMSRPNETKIKPINIFTLVFFTNSFLFALALVSFRCSCCSSLSDFRCFNTSSGTQVN